MDEHLGRCGLLVWLAPMLDYGFIVFIVIKGKINKRICIDQ